MTSTERISKKNCDLLCPTNKKKHTKFLPDFPAGFLFTTFTQPHNVFNKIYDYLNFRIFHICLLHMN